MLHYETVEPSTLELLKYLQKCPGLEKMRLSGGTALALQVGHRKSLDLDFFGELSLDNDDLTKILEPHGKVKKIKKTTSISVFLVNEIKVDFVQYNYPWLTAAVNEDGITLAGLMDIGAMKLAAITGRGRKRDFYDLYFLLRVYTLSQLVDFYNAKYNDGSEFMLLKSLNYFEDAEEDLDPELVNPLPWKEVKEKITTIHRDYVQQA